MPGKSGEGPEQPAESTSGGAVDTSGEEKVNAIYDERLKKMHDVLFASRDIAQ